jgi:Zinc finger, C2H2 type
MSAIVCDECNKKFTTRRSLKYHTENKVCRKIISFICEFCNKPLSSAPSLSRHRLKTCKQRKKMEDNDLRVSKIRGEMYDEINIAKIYDMLIKLKEENNELKVKVTRMEEEPNVSNTVNNNCSINNGTVNNFYLVGYGKEDMAKINHNDLLNGIKTGFNSTYNLIDIVHFNPDYPEFHNVYISSMKNKYAMMYDGDDWTLVMKDALINKMYDDKRNYIEENLDDFLESLTNSQKNALYRWMDADDDHDYIQKIKNSIKLLLYNKRKLPINNKGKLIEYSDEELDIVDLDSESEDTIPIITMPKTNVKLQKKRRIKPAKRTGLKRKILKARRAS